MTELIHVIIWLHFCTVRRSGDASARHIFIFMSRIYAELSEFQCRVRDEHGKSLFYYVCLLQDFVNGLEHLSTKTSGDIDSSQWVFCCLFFFLTKFMSNLWWRCPQLWQHVMHLSCVCSNISVDLSSPDRFPGVQEGFSPTSVSITGSLSTFISVSHYRTRLLFLSPEAIFHYASPVLT